MPPIFTARPKEGGSEKPATVYGNKIFKKIRPRVTRQNQIRIRSGDGKAGNIGEKGKG